MRAKYQYSKRKLNDEELAQLKDYAILQNINHKEDSDEEDTQADQMYSFLALALAGIPHLVDEVLKHRSQKKKSSPGKRTCPYPGCDSPYTKRPPCGLCYE